MSPTVLLPPSSVGLALIGLLSIPSLRAITRQIRRGAPKDNFYEDRDGISTPEAVAGFSNNTPKVVILLFTLLGLGCSTAISVLTTLDPYSHEYGGLFFENWLVTASWSLILVQVILLGAIHAPVQVHDLGRWIFLSSLINGIVLILQACSVVEEEPRLDRLSLILRTLTIVAFLVTLFASVLIPRRPAVFFRNQPVDSQRASSILDRNTWTFASPLINLASKKGDLEEKDIPQPDHTIRAEEVLEDWKAFGYKGKLIWALLYIYRTRFVVQWSVTIARCILGLGPFWTMLKLITLLQERGGGGSPSRELWGLVVLLSVLSFFEQWIDGWCYYYSIAMIAQPMKAQLSALIYEKSLRRKNVKAADKQKEYKMPSAAGGEEIADASLLVNITNVTDSVERANAENALTENGARIKEDDNKKESPAPSSEDSSVLKSAQAVVNLVGVDTKRISSFAAIQFLIISSFGKLLVYSAFLIKLMGWIPFAVGIVAWALVLPFNTYFSKRYMKLSEKLMKIRDTKLALVNEALMGIRQIKFAALEKQWERRIMDLREDELKMTWQVFLGDTALFACWVVSPILLAACSLATYALINGDLSPSVAFVSISIFKSLEITLGALPELLTDAFDTLVSIRRIDTYLSGPEMKKTLTVGSEVAFDNATIAWPVDDETSHGERFVLQGLNFTFPAGELSVISGQTGSGKSLVLSALIGEVDLLDGSIFVPPTLSPFERHDSKAHPGNWILSGSVAYVAQTPWLETASLRDNILFGLPLIDSRYQEVLEVCALKKDLEILTDSDMTELGASGINLSGGQKWRVTLARAIYSRAEILILDDIFSAVDAHVGRQIFEQCISGDICEGRTRILVTHHVALVQPKTKFLIELGEGTVLHAGLTSDLAKDGTLQKIKSKEEPHSVINTDEGADSSTIVGSEGTSVNEPPEGEDSISSSQGASNNAKDTKGPKKFIQEETREKGVVDRRIYAAYMSACGGWAFWVFCALIFLGAEASNLGRGWWVRIWTGGHDSEAVCINAYEEHSYAYGFTLQHGFSYPKYGLAVAKSSEHDLAYYLWIYVLISLIMGVVGTLRFWIGFLMSIKGSRVLYSRILNTVLRTPLRWLDTVPVGRILNRLTSDFETIDSHLTMDFSMLFWYALSLGGVFVAGVLVSPYIIPPASVLIAVAAFIGRKYLSAARPLKRLESTSKSPVFELFNSTLSGISTLRAFQKTSGYVERMYSGLDNWNIITVYMWSVNRWLGFRLALVGMIFTITIGIFVIMSPQVDAAMAGFTISFALGFSVNMMMAIREYSELELDMNAAERVIEYSELKTETQDGQNPPAAWPTSGSMEVRDLVVSYAEDLPPVLKGVSFKVKNNERIGVIGRTGAGKSSLTLALFRFLEARSGTIHIDGLDIAKIDLHSLRSRLAIIPQDPVLFSGTIRSNLDPFNDRTDDELREALTRVHLVDSTTSTPVNGPYSTATSTTAPTNTNIFRSLSNSVSESGGNLSQGQRQLLCLARAIVSRPKIMVLDEATSAVDMTTDALIQRSIREEFADSTLIVIAHRLSTIADFDRILVLSDGQAAEFGTPRELWEKECGIFRDMCESSGEKNKLKEAIFRGNHSGNLVEL